MIKHTNAYARFKEQGAELYDFFVLLSLAIPCLDREIASIQGSVAGKIPDAFYFRTSPKTAEELKKRIQNAGDIMGKELLMSTFSFFEAYIVDVTKEVINHHGGKDRIMALFIEEVRHIDNSETPEVKKSKRKLQDAPAKNLKQKFQSHNRRLRNLPFCFPSQRLAAFGWKTLCELSKRGVKADSIPDVLQTALLFQISDKDISTYRSLQRKRNSIAHGTLTHYPVADAIKHGIWLRDLAVSIDQYLVENFFLVELSVKERV